VAEDRFRSDFAQLVRDLLDESQRRGPSIADPLRDHLGGDITGVAVHGESLEPFDLPNLQLALDAALARPGVEAQVIGVAGQGRRFGDIGLADLLSSEWHLGIGAPEYVNVPIAPHETLACLTWGVLLVTTPEGRLAVFVRQGQEHGPAPGLAVQAVAHDSELSRRFLAELRVLMDEHDVFRNKVITIEADRHGRRRVVFLERPAMEERELVLPDGVLERVERHVVGPSRHREALLALGRHLGRGLLLWGPPGTGKTHTVRYLASRLGDATVIILSGPSLGLVGAFGTLARRLAPAVVVLEDVDLVAQERSFGPFGASSPALFELMNEMSGLAADADVAFVLTTNRPDALEPALAARPGRVDLAVEIPLPAEPERRRLLELYGAGLDLEPGDLDEVVLRTAGMTASFFRELLRKAALAAVESGRDRVERDDVLAALEELLAERSTLTRVLLGSEAPQPGAPHAWLQPQAVES
jgi:ATPase family protein associated with various cellular activities (AAA)